MEVENPTIDQKALLVLSTDKDLTVPQAEINGIRKFVLTCKTEGELMAPLNKKLNDFFTRHTNFIQKVLKKNKILFEEKRVKVHVIEQVLTGNFSLVYSKFFEESLLRERQINFDEKLKRCHDVPKKYWCKSYIPTSSYDWLNIIESIHSTTYNQIIYTIYVV